ncbi:MAG: ATP-grasp domain-containing protein [Desulfobulbaceae bacterium]|nr:ATP-grasp domain-containing protein [Desulfobulbaceae bacterium]
MFFVDKPYISDFFKQTVRDHDIPVVGTDIAQKLSLYDGTRIISEDEAIALARENRGLPIYTTSENAIGWISEHLPFSTLPAQIDLFKNKVKFREITQSIFPDFYFKEVRVEDLPELQLDEIPLPFVIKPSVGFFSMGVFKVSNPDEWWGAVESITTEIEQVKGLYPNEVLDTSSFIIEQCINGEEFAMDAYFDDTGQPVILGIFKHTFASETDVSDRVYTTSKEIIETNLAEFTAFAGKIGKLAGVTNFPVHIELRRDQDGTLLPIEVNPMRFGGWCTTADLTFMAYGINPYLYYYSQQKPDWPEIIKNKEKKLFSIIILDNSTGINADEIISFDYDKLLQSFNKPLELRKVDHRQYPVFGILFAETRTDNFIELKNILDSTLNEFITT